MALKGKFHHCEHWNVRLNGNTEVSVLFNDDVKC